MTPDSGSVGQQLQRVGEHREVLQVRLSRELITLLSEQLYQSPNKAIEELVVNSFDADASSCHVVVPIVSAGTSIGALPLIAVYDDGTGMDAEGLGDLWRVGSSKKRTSQIEQLRKRRQIGKFGIGKLATYALANRITYLTSAGNGEVLALSLSFEEFKSSPSGQEEQPVTLDVRSISLDDIKAMPLVVQSAEAAGLTAQTAFDPSRHWTLVLLEELKTRAKPFNQADSAGCCGQQCPCDPTSDSSLMRPRSSPQRRTWVLLSVSQ
jgi:Histidine kinase-, DNA gyrase B-, and HSP90-like ATPase